MAAASAIYRFVTHDCGAALTFGLVVDARDRPDGAPRPDLGKLAVAARQHSEACAYGKIALLEQGGIATFQATGDGKVLPVFCGNSTAAAIRCAGEAATGLVRVTGMASAPYQVEASLAGDLVSQRWILPDSRASASEWRGRKLVLTEALNRYAIIAGGLPDGIDAARALDELLGGGGAAKLAIIGETDGETVAEFYNANGQHGALPQTGLATLALAARSVGWLGALFADGRLTYPTRQGLRQVMLPEVAAQGSQTVTFTMPEIAVNLEPMAEEIAA